MTWILFFFSFSPLHLPFALTHGSAMNPPLFLLIGKRCLGHLSFVPGLKKLFFSAGARRKKLDFSPPPSPFFPHLLRKLSRFSPPPPSFFSLKRQYPPPFFAEASAKRFLFQGTMTLPTSFLFSYPTRRVSLSFHSLAGVPFFPRCHGVSGIASPCHGINSILVFSPLPYLFSPLLLRRIPFFLRYSRENTPSPKISLSGSVLSKTFFQ